MRAQTVAKLIGVAILIFVIIIAASTSTYVVQPGYRGVEVTLGKVSPVFKPEGFGMKSPFMTHDRAGADPPANRRSSCALLFLRLATSEHGSGSFIACRKLRS